MNLRGVITDATLDQLRSDMAARRSAVIEGMGQLHVLHQANRVPRRCARIAFTPFVRVAQPADHDDGFGGKGSLRGWLRG